MHDYKLIAMIPARMGSRRIPKKNIRYMLDKPLIQYPIDLALNCGAFDSVWVNTESAPLGRACEKLGAKFHQRPPELSTDTATNRDFVYEFLKKHDCDYVVMINPTSPALRQETLDSFVRFLSENDYDSIMSVIAYQAEAFYEDQRINFTGEDKIPSERLTPVETVIWAISAWKRETFISMQESGQCPIFGGKLGRFAIPKDESAYLDTEEDWNIAQAALLARRETEFSAPRYMTLDEDV